MRSDIVPGAAFPGRIVQKDLDIAEYTDTEHDPMIPHTLVLGPGLVVHSIYNGYWIRPDWDLSTPGLREKWDAGDHSPFHGWSKRSVAAGNT